MIYSVSDFLLMSFFLSILHSFFWIICPSCPSSFSTDSSSINLIFFKKFS